LKRLWPSSASPSSFSDGPARTEYTCPIFDGPDAAIDDTVAASPARRPGKTVAVNLRTDRYDMRIDRQSRWGNPFIIGRHGTRDEVIARHRRWLWQRIRAGAVSLEDLAALYGLRLGCHCAPLPCHGDTLAAAADWAHRRIAEDPK